MSDFLTRVELHDAKWPDEYISRLHSAMAREGFSRTITDEKGIVYELPVAEYYKSTSENIEQVLERAKKAVTTTGKKFGAFFEIATCSKLMAYGKPIASERRRFRFGIPISGSSRKSVGARFSGSSRWHFEGGTA